MVLKTRALWICSWLVIACDMAPLRRQDLFTSTSEPDAGTLARDASVQDAVAADTGAALPSDGTAPPDVQLCTPGSMNGLLSGSVVDKCTGRPVDALVGIAGQHTCAFSGKGSFFFRGLPTGCVLTLSSAAPGYKVFSKAIVIPDGARSEDIQLERASGSCNDPAPEAVTCRCDRPGCV